VKLNVPLAVGLPLRTPEELNDSHEGSPLANQTSILVPLAAYGQQNNWEMSHIWYIS
jgi:hypothetical protein